MASSTSSTSSGSQSEKKSGNSKRSAAETTSGRPTKLSGAGKAEVSAPPTSQVSAIELGAGLQALLSTGERDPSATQDREGFSPSSPHSGLNSSAAHLAHIGTESESGCQQPLHSLSPTMGGGQGFIFGQNGEDIMSRVLGTLLQNQTSLRTEVREGLQKNEETARNLRRS